MAGENYWRTAADTHRVRVRDATDAWRRPSSKNFWYNMTTMLGGGLFLVSAVGLYAVYADRRHKAFDVARVADRVAERPPPQPPPTPAESDPRK